jgi:hypothetical protein
MPGLSPFQNRADDVWCQLRHSENLTHPPLLKLEAASQLTRACRLAGVDQLLPVESFAQRADQWQIE